jgi:predicted glutamine amidotransferase
MCGIAGFIGKKGEIFNEIILNYLLLAQDSRGKDNFGVFYTTRENNQRLLYVHRGAKNVDGKGTDISSFHKHYEKEGKFWAGKKPKFYNPCIVIGHSRSSSRGGVTLSDAHPIIAKNSEENPTRTVIGVHNGTITNETEIERHFGLSLDYGSSDSVLIFNIFAQGEKETLEFLSMYRGSAALVWHIKEEPNKVYVWAGKETYSKVNTPERPLHYVQTKAGIYISSEHKPLDEAFLTLPNRKKYLESNTIDSYHFAMDAITVIEDGEIVEVIKVDRNPTKSTNSFSLPAPRYLGHEEDSDFYNRLSKKNRSGCVGSSASEIKKSELETIKTLSAGVLNSDGLSQQELFRSIQEGRLVFSKGLYYYNGNIAHTKVKLRENVSVEKSTYNDVEIVDRITTFDTTGRGIFISEDKHAYYDVEDMTPAVNVATKELYFYRGILINNIRSLKDLHIFEIKNEGSVSGTILRSSTNFPIWSGLFNRKEDKKDCLTFIKPTTLLNHSDPIDGLVIWPYVNRGYIFKESMIVEVLTKERTEHFKETYATFDNIKYCLKCKGTVVSDCPMCDDKCSTNAFQKVLDNIDEINRYLEEEQEDFKDKEYIVVCDDCGSVTTQNHLERCDTCSSINIEELEDEETSKIKAFFIK